MDREVDSRLAGLQAVTEVALAYLDIDDLFSEVLDRVLEAVGADTAAVLLADESGAELFARAARGIEEEVRQGVRVPFGVGFAGRVAAERRPLVLDRIDETTVWNPILWRTGIRTMLGVPLLGGGSVIGVLHVGTLGERTFTDDDVHLLEVAGDRIASALRLRLLESERTAAEALQRSLLPSTPPQLGRLEFAARYVASEHGGIGGDWYDAFVVEDGTVWTVIGDVAGHGLRAAVVMGRIRSALRSYALLSPTPDDLLSMTDRKVQHFDIGHLATVAVAAIPPPYDEMHLALAGHPPPVVAAPGAAASLLSVEAGPPLGAGATGEPWAAASVPLGAGSVVVFYTDGLVERRHEHLDVGLERLRSSVIVDAPAAVCEHVMSAVVGRYVPADDIALLAMRRQTHVHAAAE